MTRHPSKTLARTLSCALTLLLAVACQTPDEGPSTDSRTGGWGLACQFDAACDSEYACICGVCTAPCPDDACAQGACTPITDLAACAGEPAGEVCLATCDDPSDCAGFQDPACTGGVCAENVPGPDCRWDVDLGANWTPASTDNLDCLCVAEDQSCHAVLAIRPIEIVGNQVSVQTRFVDSDWANTPVDWEWGTSIQPQQSCFDPAPSVARATGQVALGQPFQASIEIATDAEFNTFAEGTTVWLSASTGSASNPSSAIYFSGTGIPVTKVCER